MRIDKLLAHMGYGTRKDVKKIIKDGNVRVNQEVVTKVGQIVNEKDDQISVFDEIVEYQKYYYLMLNKPKDVISATTDNRHQTVLDLVSDIYGHVDLFPVGRLDIDTTGLLLLTNNGKLAHELLSPKKHVVKKYFAIIQDIVTPEDIDAFAKGMDLGDFITKPAELTIIHIDNENHLSEIEVTISEGKFHQVKRMFEYVGKKVLELHRESMGPIELDPDLALGDFRLLTTEEEELLVDYGLE